MILADLTESDGTRTITVGLLDTAGGGSGLASSLRCQLLTGGFPSGRLTGGLLGTVGGNLINLLEGEEEEEGRCGVRRQWC